MDDKPDRIKFTEIIHALSDADTPLPPRLLRGFSDLLSKDLRELDDIWPNLSASRKIALLEDLEDLVEHDTLVNLDELAKYLLADEIPAVRVMAIRLLWEYERTNIVPAIVELLRGDPDEAVRSASAALLGKFVLLGELDSIPDAIKISVVNNLLEVTDSVELPQVKQRALESLGYSSHPAVPALIRAAFESSDTLWIASALCAMGRSVDDQWADSIISKLSSPEPEIQFEAIRATGELELESARDELISLLDEEIAEVDVRMAAIWALSQIGGDEAKEKLDELLENAADDEEVELIEKAMDNLEYSDPSDTLDMLDYDPDEEDTLDLYDDEVPDENDF